MTDGISLLCSALHDVGVDCVFGLPGTQTVPLYEGFRRSGMRTVLSTHELAASFMANGYFRATGRVAAVSTIPGPGFTYALTGIAEAHLDSVGMIVLVGAPARSPGNRFQLQAIDQQAVARPIVKEYLRIDRAADAARVIHHAHELALNGGPGPVVVELDIDALSAPASAHSADTTPLLESSVDTHAIASLEHAFGAAERPVFLLGQGALGVADRVSALSRTLGIPVVTTPSARGVVPEDSKYVTGFDSPRGQVDELNRFLGRADLIVGLGCRLGHNGTAGFALALPSERFIHVDADAAVLGANYPARLLVRATAEQVLPALETRRAPGKWTVPELDALRAALRARAGAHAEPVIAGSSASTPVEFFAWLRRVLPRDAILVTDSGAHQGMTRRHYEVLAPRGLLFPSDLQSMGYGLPAAIGARIAAPTRPVVALIGDGGFAMSGLELLTAVRERIGMSVIVFNDGQLGQIRLQQLSNYGHG
ncbi:MAG TPA: thiamine pyrophosphate-binding protein, partial [Gemmatimonadaceae bacterium]|nr:thiamine pyrophosphate-binding protein [Gemmatimonadaceae bacterium]